LLLAGAGIVAGAIVLLVFETKVGAGSPEPTNFVKVTPVDSKRVEGSTCGVSQIAAPVITVVVRSFDPQTESVALGLGLCFSAAAAEHLTGASGSVYRPAIDRPGCARLMSRSAGAVAALVLHSDTGIDDTLPTPLPPVICPAANKRTVGDVTMPLWGNPSHYPSDWYEANLGFRVQIGLSRPGSGIVLVREAPSTVRPLVGTGIAPLVVRAAVRTRRPTATPGLTFELRRTFLTKAFVVFVVFIPAALEFLLLIVLLPRAYRGELRLGPELLAGVAAVLVAILPIRLVLVPPTVGTLTHVDYFLALQMAILVAIVCLAIALTLLSGRPSSVAAPTQEATDG
jgi:hypothetical protein